MLRAGTDGGGGGRSRARMALAALLWCGLALTVATLGDRLPAGWLAGTTGREPALPAAHTTGPTVLFVVLDNVRADRTSLCGHDRPTTPVLEGLRDAGASYTCAAYAPASWTFPSHASYFTGLELPDHGADVSPAGTVEWPWGLAFDPLAADVPTLAEQMAARGYQTAAVSANPVVSAPTGLTRGFGTVRSATTFGELGGAALVRTVGEVLREGVDPAGGPLFLFVNIADAHEPWDAIPAELGWAPPRPRLSFDPRREDDDRRRYMRGEMSAEEAARLRAHVADVYDYGVHRADHTLGLLLEALEDAGWLGPGHRLVVTSDHGELLGDHGLVGHEGSYLHEGLSRVPLLVTGGPRLDGVVSAIAAHDLVAGEAPRPRPVRAGAFAYPNWPTWFGIGRLPGAAAWTDAEKLLWADGRYVRYDLRADPEAERPLPVADDDPALAELRPFAERVEAAMTRPGRGQDAKGTDLLRSLGYVE